MNVLGSIQAIEYHVPSLDAWTKTDTKDVDPPIFKQEKGIEQTR